MAYIEFNHVTKKYASGEASIYALKDACFSVEKGELAVILLFYSHIALVSKKPAIELFVLSIY